MSRSLGSLLSAALVLALAAPLSAQDAPEPAAGAGDAAADTTASPAAGAGDTPAEPAPTPAASVAPAQPSAPARPAPPPIMVVVATTGRLPDDVVAAVQQGLVEHIAAMAGGRPVHPLAAAELRDAILECREDACIGGHLAQARAQAGVIARVRARGRRPLEVTLEMRDPVSGTPRLEPVRGELPFDAALIPEAAAALVEPLRPAMPAPPPPPPTLLVTTTVDGARVQIDGQEIGTSPVAAVEVAEGQHEIVVLRAGYLSARRQVRVQAGQRARVDVTLEPIGGSADGGSDAVFGEDAQQSEELTDQWWFWTAVGGGAALVVGIVIGVAVAASSGGQGPQTNPTGIMLPPITTTGGM